MRRMRHAGLTGLFSVMALLGGCAIVPPTAPKGEEPGLAARESPEVAALVARLHLKRPTKRSDREGWIKIFDRDGKVTRSRPIAQSDLRHIAAQMTGRWEVRIALSNRPTSLYPTGPSAVGPQDTTLTFYVDSEEWTLTAASGASEYVAAVENSSQVPQQAYWTDYSIGGDTLFIEAVYSQVYDNAELYSEMYLPSSAIEELNELIQAELAPEVPAAYEEELGCFESLAAFFTVSVLATRDVSLWAGIPVVGAVVSGLVAIARVVAVVGALKLVLCACPPHYCFEEAPPGAGFQPAETLGRDLTAWIRKRTLLRVPSVGPTHALAGGWS